MWAKIKIALLTALAFIIGFFGFICGMLFYRNRLDKPETSVTNTSNVDIGKVKAKDGNVSVTLPVPEYSGPVTTADIKPKNKLFDFLKRKKS